MSAVFLYHGGILMYVDNPIWCWYRKGREGGGKECYYNAIYEMTFNNCIRCPDKIIILSYYYLGKLGGYKELTKWYCYKRSLKGYHFTYADEWHEWLTLYCSLNMPFSENDEEDNITFNEYIDFTTTYLRKVMDLGSAGGGWLYDTVWCDANECYDFVETIDKEYAEHLMCNIALSQVYTAMELEQKVINPKLWFRLGLNGGGVVFDEDYTPAQCYEYAVRLNPNKYRYWYNLGYIGGTEKYPQKECFIRALKVNKKHLKSWLWLGKCGGGIVDEKHYSRQHCFEEVLKIDPMNLIASDNLSKILDKEEKESFCC